MAWYRNERDEPVRCAYRSLHGLVSYDVQPGEVVEGPANYVGFFKSHGLTLVAPDGPKPETAPPASELADTRPLPKVAPAIAESAETVAVPPPPPAPPTDAFRRPRRREDK